MTSLGYTAKHSRSANDGDRATLVISPRIMRILIPLLAVVGMGVIALYLLWPTMANGYNGDDALNSTAPMLMKSDNMSYWELVVDNAQNWARSDGRFFPLSMAETALVFLVFTTRFAYKAYQLGIVIVDLVLVAYVVGRATKNASAGYLTAFLALLAFQLRQFFDPIMLFSGQQQIVVALALATLAFIWVGCEKGNPWFFIGGFLTWTTVLLTYETSYLLLPAYWVVIYFIGSQWRTRIWAFVSLTLPTFALLLFVAHLRSEHPSSSASYQFNFDPVAVSHTFVKQVTAAIPLSYPTLAHKYYPDTTWAIGNKLILVGLIALSIALLAVIVPRVRVSRKSGLLLTLFGLAIWFMPSLIVSLTKGRQTQVTPGSGYVSEYIGYFGFAIVASMFIAMIVSYRRYIPRFIAVALIALMGTGSGVAFAVTRSNNVISAHTWDDYRYPREVFERSISRGVMAEVAPDSKVVTLQPGIWFNYSLIEWYGGPHVVKVEAPFTNASLPACKTFDATCFSQNGPQWLSNHSGDSDGNGISMMARISGAAPNDADRPTVLSNDVYLYVESDAIKQGAAMPTVDVATQSGNDVKHLQAATFTNSDFTVVKSGDGWAMLHTTRPMTVDRLTVNINGSQVGSLVPF